MGKIGQIPWNKEKKGVYSKKTLKAMRLSHLANFKTEDAVELYEQGKSCKETANILNCSYSAMWRRLYPLGILRNISLAVKGKSKSEKAIKNMRIAQQKRFNDSKEREKMTGSGNPAWIDGRSYIPYTSEFNKQLKKLIRLRDNYTCQKCGCTEIEEGKRLCVHHIDYDKKNCLPDNLITLCGSCNTKVNNNRLMWTKYFQEKTKED